ncbi:MAG: response regulator [Chitinophagales bacterium]
MNQHVTILVADDDDDDKQLIKYALDENKVTNPVQFAQNGEELLQILQDYNQKHGKCMPAVILLDLNMPKMDGREALKRLKAHASWRAIPVIVLSTSTAQNDISSSYHLGAASYIAKPSGYEKLVDLVKNFNAYWFDSVVLCQ